MNPSERQNSPANRMAMKFATKEIACIFASALFLRSIYLPIRHYRE